MPRRSDSGSKAAGNASAALGRPEYAAEFLRRNRNYRTQYARLMRRIQTGAVNEAAARHAFARNWGLSFRLRAV